VWQGRVTLVLISWHIVYRMKSHPSRINSPSHTLTRCVAMAASKVYGITIDVTIADIIAQNKTVPMMDGISGPGNITICVHT